MTRNLSSVALTPGISSRKSQRTFLQFLSPVVIVWRCLAMPSPSGGREGLLLLNQRPVTPTWHKIPCGNRLCTHSAADFGGRASWYIYQLSVFVNLTDLGLRRVHSIFSPSLPFCFDLTRRKCNVQVMVWCLPGKLPGCEWRTYMFMPCSGMSFSWKFPSLLNLKQPK